MARARTKNSDQLAGVQRVRNARVRPAYDHSLAPDMDRAIREAAKQRRSTGACAEAWASVVPGELAARTALVGLSKGALTVRVPDAATRFELDRFLRSGGLRSLEAACRASLSRVRLVVAGSSS